MKNTSLITFFAALIVGEIFITGYWVRQDPKANQTASILRAAFPVIPPQTASHDEPKFSISSTNNWMQALRETRTLAVGESDSKVDSKRQPTKRGFSTLRSQSGQEGVPPTLSDPRNAQVQQTSIGVSAGEDARSSAQLPLAFRDLPPGVAASKPEMAAALKALQQDFLDAIGGPDQNPSDPVYYGRWVSAQKSLDEEYRLLVGNQTFLGTQEQINNQ